jgi:hypothetical protein
MHAAVLLLLLHRAISEGAGRATMLLSPKVSMSSPVLQAVLVNIPSYAS